MLQPSLASLSCRSLTPNRSDRGIDRLSECKSNNTQSLNSNILYRIPQICMPHGIRAYLGSFLGDISARAVIFQSEVRKGKVGIICI